MASDIKPPKGVIDLDEVAQRRKALARARQIAPPVNKNDPKVQMELAEQALAVMAQHRLDFIGMRAVIEQPLNLFKYEEYQEARRAAEAADKLLSALERLHKLERAAWGVDEEWIKELQMRPLQAATDDDIEDIHLVPVEIAEDAEL